VIIHAGSICIIFPMSSSSELVQGESDLLPMADSLGDIA
jgi:hypothetical protein